MIQERALHSLKTLLPKGQVFTDRATLIAYEADAGLDKGLPDGVVLPRSAEELRRIVRWATEQRVPLIARGAGTGLSGGAVADRGGVIVEFVALDRLLDLDVEGRCAEVEPALINLRLDQAAKTQGLYFPPDPSSQRASTMGGNVAENSGGPHCFKYGVTTNYVTGMDVVLMDGSHIHVGGRALDYPEYDLCGLLTGSEGTLALITAITVRLLRNPPGVATLLAVFDSVEQAGAAVSAIIATGIMPATMEMMDRKIVGIIEPFAHAGLPLDAGAVLIIEVDGYVESLATQIAEVEQILATHGGHDMRIARDAEERYKIWLARKSAAGGIAREAPAYYTVDITVPRSRLAEMLAEVNQICDRLQLRAGHVFHAGDGNLHPLILIPEPDNPDLIQRVHTAGWEMVKHCVAMGGSLTGEHGVGIEKRQYMPLMHTQEELLAMWEVKQVFDPNNLLNPGKIFPLPAENETGPFAGYNPTKPMHMETELAQPLPERYAPTSPVEAAELLKRLALAGRKVQITGNAPYHSAQGSAQSLSTSALSGIKHYAPEDLAITVGAGTPLSEVQAFLARERKQLAMASPWPTATIGGLIAANVNAPLRLRYGALRDQVLCATVALADGRVIRTGRAIVKNVAGFDLTKVFVGSYGTLGVITDLSLKISALPRARRTLLLPVETLQQGLDWGKRLLNVVLTASALVLCHGHPSGALPQATTVLAYTAEGEPEDVRAELAQVRELLRQAGAPEPVESEVVTGTELWQQALAQAGDTSLLVRVGVPVSALADYGQEQAQLLVAGPCVLDLGNGFAYISRQFATVEEVQSCLQALRAPALAAGGYALVMSEPAQFQGKLDRWGYRPQGLELMKRLKMCWDEHDILRSDLFVL